MGGWKSWRSSSSPGTRARRAAPSRRVGSGPSEELPPREVGRVAEDVPRLVDAEQRVVAVDVLANRHAGEDLGHELAAGAPHDPVARRGCQSPGAGGVGPPPAPAPPRAARPL